MGLKQLFFQKTYKNRPAALPRDPHNHRRLGAPPQDPPSVIRLSTLAYSTRLLS